MNLVAPSIMCESNTAGRGLLSLISPPVEPRAPRAAAGRGGAVGAAAHDGTASFNELVWPYAAAVLRVARCMVRDAAEADDMAQETLVKAFKGLGQFRVGTDVRAWLMTILRNVRNDHFRAAKASPATASFETLGVDPACDPDDAGHDDDDRSWDDPRALLERFSDPRVIRALRTLPEEIRWTLLLVDVEGMDHADAAAVMAVPPGTVKSRAFRGRGMLRAALMSLAKDLRLVD